MVCDYGGLYPWGQVVRIEFLDYHRTSAQGSDVENLHMHEMTLSWGEHRLGVILTADTRLGNQPFLKKGQSKNAGMNSGWGVLNSTTRLVSLAATIFLLISSRRSCGEGACRGRGFGVWDVDKRGAVLLEMQLVAG